MYYMPLPTPGTPGALYFDGKDATLFLIRFKELCASHGILTDREVLSNVWNYTSIGNGQWMNGLESYVAGNWAAFCKDVQKEFRGSDSDQIIHTRSYLEGYKKKKRTWTEKDYEQMSTYIREYTAVSGRVAEKKLIDDYTRSLWFISGFPEKFAGKILKKLDCDPEDPEKIQWNVVHKVACEIMNAADRSQRLYRDERGAVPSPDAIHDYMSSAAIRTAHLQ
jgi:hypothetical protein